MIFALLSDTHLTLDQPGSRLDNFQETQERKIEWILNWAKERDALILHGGDFFDSPRSWKALSFYISIIRKYQVPIYAVFGQHDDYFHNEATRRNTSLGVLIEGGLVKLLSEYPLNLGTIKTKPVQIYGSSCNQDIPIPTNKEHFNILVLHKNISDLEQSVFETTSASIFLRRNPLFNLILCGDIHKTFLLQEKSRIICNSGPMVRMKASIEMFDHRPGFWAYDFDRIYWVEIPYCPASEILTREHIEEEDRVDKLLNQFIEEMEKPNEQEIGLLFKENLLLFIETNTVPDRVKRILSEVMSEGGNHA